MKQKYNLGIIALAMVAVLGVGMVSAFGFGNGFMKVNNLTDEEKEKMQEQTENIQSSIESGDYETWKGLMEERITMMQSQITEENFNAIVEQHEKMLEMRTTMEEARESGDFSTMEKIREEYGIGERFGKGSGMKRVASSEAVSE